MSDDALDDFTRDVFTSDGVTHSVLRSGEGPAVIVMTEVPGISPKVADFARRVRQIGFTVVMPELFGITGRDPSPETHGTLGTAAYMLRTVAQVCISREFTVLAAGRSSPVVTWLRALARHEHERCGGPGVGAVGMCLTGGFALAMATDDRLLVPVLSQPSLPVAITRRQRNSIDITPQDLEVVKNRCAAGLQVMGLRFTSDKLVPDERFAFLRRELGDAFVAVELDDADASPEGFLNPHSVLTEHLVDEAGAPTRQALDRVLDLFRDRLLTE